MNMNMTMSAITAEHPIHIFRHVEEGEYWGNGDRSWIYVGDVSIDGSPSFCGQILPTDKCWDAFPEDEGDLILMPTAIEAGLIG